MIGHHNFEYDMNLWDEGLIAACSCGWEARRAVATIDAAEEQWDDHCDAVFMEATQP